MGFIGTKPRFLDRRQAALGALPELGAAIGRGRAAR
jgi:hypothetical protein